MSKIITIKSITEAHELLGIDKPKHPLISVFRHSPDMNMDLKGIKLSFELYFISLKVSIKGSFAYGRNTYDFDEGSLVFMAPNQIISVEETPKLDFSGWSMFFHPDLLRKSSLGNIIHDYTFFNYSMNEALQISDEEKQSLTEVANKIETEISQNMDRYTQDLILHHLDTILKYSNRYYDRQFFTRRNFNQDFIVRFEQYLKEYFASHLLKEIGSPTVKQCGEALHMSGHYLSDMLKNETGKSAKEHILLHLIEKAKTTLLNTEQSVSEIAYALGFEYPQHFSKLFKSKTNMSPTEYRRLN